MSLKYHIIPTTSLMQNSCIIWDDESKDSIILDIGGEIPAFLEFIDQNQLNLNAIWLTHGHFDHIQGVAELLSHKKVPVIGPNYEDLFWIEGLPTILQHYGFPVKESFTPTQWLKENDVLSIGQFDFLVLEIPGHTPGHVVFYSEKAKLLLAGDVIFFESIGRTDFPKGDHQQLLINIHQKLLTLPDDTKIVSGHGPETTLGHEKNHNPFLI